MRSSRCAGKNEREKNQRLGASTLEKLTASLSPEMSRWPFQILPRDLSTANKGAGSAVRMKGNAIPLKSVESGALKEACIN